MPSSPRCFALVPCAGVGARAGRDGPKQYAALQGQSVVAHTLQALSEVDRLQASLVVLAADDSVFESHAPRFNGPRAWVARCGGDTRAQTVTNGLLALRERGAADEDWVLVHDAARCLLRPVWVDRLIDACIGDDVGGLLALPLADTLKAADNKRVAGTLDRRDKWLAQTPQMFRLNLLQRALTQAGHDVTDESSAIEALGLRPKLVEGDIENLKLTWPADFALAARLLQTRVQTRQETR
jgi:2-C-methyl-D-erythritol 4-phosphate cytidylyltransferase